MAPMPHMSGAMIAGPPVTPLSLRCYTLVWSCASRSRSIAGARETTREGGRSMYRIFGRIHAATGRWMGPGPPLGQGTVEYVALILLVALVMAGVVAAMKGFKTDEGKELGDIVLGKIKEAVRKVEF
jgi:hypothetical protein